jgi:hypothetical protein
VRSALALSLVVFVVAGAARAQPTSVDAIVKAVTEAQFEDGAIANTRAARRAGNAFVTTYNFGGLALVKAYEMTGRRAYLDGARRFVEFWMSRQNETPDRWDVVGTFYDQVETDGLPPRPFVYTDGASRGGVGYDASDADPPIIAITALRWFEQTHDVAFLRKHAAGFDRIGGAVVATLQDDGLTWSHPNYKVKYLMDAAEAQAGLAALETIFRAVGDDAKTRRYHELSERMRAGIGSLWQRDGGHYAWAKFEDGKLEPMDWAKMYPDSVEQLWPALWGSAGADSDESSRVWTAFSARYPKWTEAELDWPAIGRFAILRGDLAAAKRQADRVLERRLNDAAWEVNQMYWTLLNCAAKNPTTRRAGD